MLKFLQLTPFEKTLLRWPWEGGRLARLAVAQHHRDPKLLLFALCFEGKVT